MFKEFKTYTILCDNCGVDLLEGSDYSGYLDKEACIDELADCGWYTDGDKHFCENCYEYDEDDNVVLKKGGVYAHIPDGDYFDYILDGRPYPYPRTLDDFINDAERVGIELEWKR